MRKTWQVLVVSTVLAPCPGLVPSAWAYRLNDPQQEYYSQHVIPYYNIGSPWISVLVLADTSFARGPDVIIRFFDQTCNLRRDIFVAVDAA